MSPVHPPIDPKLKGHELAPHHVEIEKSQLAAFAHAIGEPDPIYFEENAAKAAGFRSIVMLPTFAFSLFNFQPDPLAVLRLLDADPASLLHGEQGFEYMRTVCAGDRLSFTSRIADIYDKKNGALRFVDLRSNAHNQAEEEVFQLRTLYVLKASS